MERIPRKHPLKGGPEWGCLIGMCPFKNTHERGWRIWACRYAFELALHVTQSQPLFVACTNTIQPGFVAKKKGPHHFGGPFIDVMIHGRG